VYAHICDEADLLEHALAQLPLFLVDFMLKRRPPAVRMGQQAGGLYG